MTGLATTRSAGLPSGGDSPLLTRTWEASRGTVAAVVGLIGFWYLVGWVVPRLPVPHEVVVAAAELLAQPSTYVDLADTLRRVLVGFAGGLIVGGALGLIMGWSPLWRGLLKPWTIAALSVPGPVLIIVTILLLGIGEASALVALVISVSPYVANLVMDSVGTLDPALAETGKVFRLSRVARWRHLILPQLVTGLLAAVRTAFGLSWKLVVVIEALGTSRGVGAQMHRSFRILDTAQGIAWAVLFTLIMWAVDSFVFTRVERRLLRWRRMASID